MTYKELTLADLHVTPKMVYVQMGYGDTQPTPEVMRETDEVLRLASVSRPAFCYTVLRERPPFSFGHTIERQLQQSEAYALFLCTAGCAFESLQTQLKPDPLLTFIADALGSVISERTADLMEDTLQVSINKLGWKHTNRFSPGYCGWSLTEQQQLFDLFGEENPCHIRLTESCLMLPIKSVSGIIGLGCQVRHQPYTCGFCNKSDCFLCQSKRLG